MPGCLFLPFAVLCVAVPAAFAVVPVAGPRLARLEWAVSVIVALLLAVLPGRLYAAVSDDGGSYQGLWWAAPAGAESGWGISLAHQGDTIFAIWSTYDTEGAGWWLSMAAQRTAEGTYAGQLIETHGPAFSATPFSPTTVRAVPVGTGMLTFSDEDRGVFSYVVNGVAQAKPITRQLFGVPPSCAGVARQELAQATNYQDLWWVANGAESGWGINVAHQGDTIFATWFTYDPAGAPMWLATTATRTVDRTYAGSLYRTTGPRFEAIPFDPRLVRSDVTGSATLAFADGNSATFAYTLNGVSQSKAITRQLFAPTAGTRCTAASAMPFQGAVVLGAPTARSIRAKIFSPAQDGTVLIEYGTGSGVFGRRTPEQPLVAGQPLVVDLSDLTPDTRYYYRLWFRARGSTAQSVTEEHAFHTARSPGSAFTFTVQADSHLDENSDLNLYRRTLLNVRADAPDFHIDLGDTFMAEKHSSPLSGGSPTATEEGAVDARYRYELEHFALVTSSVPLFLVNGNHEGESGWLADGTANNLAVWTSNARGRYFVNPTPDDFYGGDPQVEPHVGQRASWYAWHWGDALFVVLDPYWNTKARTNVDPWVMTLGERQFHWLEQTLADSAARHKFVFIHSLVGGLDGQMRGGVEAAPYFEWGGRSTNGASTFATKRSGWSMPIHDLLVRHGVTAVFHGHDHLYARQELDGVVYQEVPQPSAKNSASGPGLAAEYHYASGAILSSSGHLRVTVDSLRVRVDYVRAWLPASETAQRINGEIAGSYSIPAR